MSTIEDLATYLVAAGLGLTSGSNLFGGSMPPTPDALTVLYDTAGAGPRDVAGGASLPAITNPRIQVQVRALTYNGARDTIRAIYDKLTLIVDQTIGAGSYHRVVAIQEPFLLNNDESDRTVFACNFDVLRDPE